ncbi:MAG: NUDIX domain-containing protein [Clostridia bacterium]|nr:NUDIX domain-containing protein [Clostridia bacterium]
MENWDIMNENGVITGKTVVRGRTVLKPGEYHLVVHIWVISSNGNFLIQRRSERRRLMPGEWASTGGSAISGESSVKAAARELREEIGIKAPRGTLKFAGRLKRRNSFLDIWFIKCDADISRLRLQKSEVAEVKWVTPDELKIMVEQKRYHNYGKEYFKTVFDYAEKMRREINAEQGDF